MATLYVRDVPAELYEELHAWAAEEGRSLNAEVIDLLRGESERRRANGDFARSLAAYFEKYKDQPIPVPDVVELIREGRERDLGSELGD